ncbi:uncharacterized protein LODBEIA_P39850 [Lodderomyces beijingensis]|uniref:Enhancer of mRNA-decapping protein 3 n=1 Tax=Lodderomyces beijingensis TaxID=1775926 RepID=A0ABP0ZNM6_9ASCO
MIDFLHCKVNLILKDGSVSSGTISFVDSRQITLKDAVNSKDPSITFPSLTLPNSNVADLSIIQLQQNNGNNNSKKKPKQQGKSAELTDDAILFASKPSRSGTATPKPKSSDSSNNQHQGQSHLKDLDVKVEDAKSKEFDFEANLAMFDKKAVFDNFRKKDHTQLNDRLVGHNRIEDVKLQHQHQQHQQQQQQKQQKKEKYDNDEMVLGAVPKDNWDAIGQTMTDKRKESTPTDSTRATSQRQNSQDRFKTRNFTFVNSSDGKPVQTASPVQLLEIERLSEDSTGITPLMMAETLATNLSQLIMDKCLGGSVRLSNRNNHNLPPLVLLLIGSGRCGSRAFATGRQLSNHGVRVLAFVISYDESDAELQQQWKLFESIGGKVVTSNFDELIDITENQLNTPVELIIDALQGYDDHLEDIFYQADDQKTLAKVITWCNSSSQRSKIMSLDLPSGIDGGSGTLTEENQKIECQWCISMGLPLTGILLGYKNEVLEYDMEDDSNGEQQDEIVHYLVDCGIPNKIYSMKPNLRKFDKFWCCAESCIKLNVTTT